MGDELRVKMFIGTNVKELEENINLWLENHTEALTEFFTIKQSVNDKITIISIWYYDEPKEDPGD